MSSSLYLVFDVFIRDCSYCSCAIFEAIQSGEAEITVSSGSLSDTLPVYVYDPLMARPSKIILTPDSFFEVALSGGPRRHHLRPSFFFQNITSSSGYSTEFSSHFLKVRGRSIQGCRDATITVGNKEELPKFIGVHDSTNLLICVEDIADVHLEIQDANPNCSAPVGLIKDGFTVKARPVDIAGREFQNFR